MSASKKPVRLNAQVLRQCVSVPLDVATYIDASGRNIGALGDLGCCPAADTLILKNNALRGVAKLETCPECWTLDVSNNAIDHLDGFAKFCALGRLQLNNNQVTWSEVFKLKHMQIVSLSLFGNPIASDPHYRRHVVDILPLLWSLDGKIITASERRRVKAYFDAHATDPSLRRKRPRTSYVRTNLRNVEVTGCHGAKTILFKKHFSQGMQQNVEVDRLRVRYLAYQLADDLLHVQWYRGAAAEGGVRGSFHDVQRATAVLGATDLEAIVAAPADQRNMLLLLLLCSLVFAIPSELMRATIEMTQLMNFNGIDTMQYFYFSAVARARVVCVLFSAAHVDHADFKEGGLYPKLYRCMSHMSGEIYRLLFGPKNPKHSLAAYSQADGANPHAAQVRKTLNAHVKSKQRRPQAEAFGNILAVELSQLLCLVPAFISFVGHEGDHGLVKLLQLSTQDTLIYERLLALLAQLNREVASSGSTNDDKASWEAYSRITSFLLERIHKDPSAHDVDEQSLNQQQSIFAAPQVATRPQRVLTARGPRSVPQQRGNQRPRAQTAPAQRRAHIRAGDLVHMAATGQVARVLAVPDDAIVLVQHASHDANDPAHVGHLLQRSIVNEAGRLVCVDDAMHAGGDARSAASSPAKVSTMRPYGIGERDGHFLLASDNFVTKVNELRPDVHTTAAAAEYNRWQPVKRAQPATFQFVPNVDRTALTFGLRPGSSHHARQRMRSAGSPQSLSRAGSAPTDRARRTPQRADSASSIYISHPSPVRSPDGHSRHRELHDPANPASWSHRGGGRDGGRAARGGGGDGGGGAHTAPAPAPATKEVDDGEIIEMPTAPRDPMSPTRGQGSEPRFKSPRRGSATITISQQGSQHVGMLRDDDDSTGDEDDEIIWTNPRSPAPSSRPGSAVEGRHDSVSRPGSARRMSMEEAVGDNVDGGITPKAHGLDTGGFSRPTSASSRPGSAHRSRPGSASGVRPTSGRRGSRPGSARRASTEQQMVPPSESMLAAATAGDGANADTAPEPAEAVTTDQPDVVLETDAADDAETVGVPSVPDADVSVPAVPDADVSVPAVPDADVSVPAVPEADVSMPAVPDAEPDVAAMLEVPVGADAEAGVDGSPVEGTGEEAEAGPTVVVDDAITIKMPMMPSTHESPQKAGVDPDGTGNAADEQGEGTRPVDTADGTSAGHGAAVDGGAVDPASPPAEATPGAVGTDAGAGGGRPASAVGRSKRPLSAAARTALAGTMSTDGQLGMQKSDLLQAFSRPTSAVPQGHQWSSGPDRAPADEGEPDSQLFARELTAALSTADNPSPAQTPAQLLFETPQSPRSSGRKTPGGTLTMAHDSKEYIPLRREPQRPQSPKKGPPRVITGHPNLRSPSKPGVFPFAVNTHRATQSTRSPIKVGRMDHSTLIGQSQQALEDRLHSNTQGGARHRSISPTKTQRQRSRTRSANNNSLLGLRKGNRINQTRVDMDLLNLTSSLGIN